MQEESVGLNFQDHDLKEAQHMGWQLLSDLNSCVEVGDTAQVLQSKLQELCSKKSPYSQLFEGWWHPVKIRLGPNTLCSFREKPLSPDYKLQTGDLYFFDFGPIFLGYEADIGESFQWGNKTFVNKAREVFDQLKAFWSQPNLKERPTGVELYERGEALAKEQHLEFNTHMKGHRLGDYPHAIHHKGPLGKLEKAVSPNRWILEVHLRDRENQQGYFFEDLL